MKALTSLFLLGLVSGCASQPVSTSPQIYTLQTARMKPIEKLAPLERVNIPGAQMNILDFEDARPEKTLVGEARTGSRNIKQPLALDIPVSEYFKDRFAQGFRTRGVNVTPTAAYGLRGKVTRFWVKEKAEGTHSESSTCDIAMELEVVKLKTQQPAFRGKASAEIEGKNAIMDAAESNGPLLETCVEQVLNKILQDGNLQALLEAPSTKKK